MLHVVTAEEAGKRTDVVVARLADAPRALVAQALKRGDVRINGSVGKASRALELGDRLEFEIRPRPALVAIPEDLDVPIVYEDE
ncbi:MAG: RNA pseudouridine synthase, partial [Candidatus Eremiobacteraeota bacterium]|nr:RNA pseudouridine synthase [Candidatus Eremiobacteraeota bacterium]